MTRAGRNTTTSSPRSTSPSVPAMCRRSLWLARMLEVRGRSHVLGSQLMRMAIEDIGMADPRALEQAVAAQHCVHFLGIPEGDQALAQITIYLAIAQKSDAAYKALNAARAEVQEGTAYPVPMQIRNASTKYMKEWGYGSGYQHAHDFEDALAPMDCLPEALKGRVFYEPTDRALEKRIRERLAEIETIRNRK